MSVELQGLIETQRRMENLVAELHGSKMLNAMRDATLIVERDAKLGAPVDTGRLRSSITPEIRADENEVIGVVGSSVTYAPYVELGYRGHWLPPGVLMVWAERHHMDPKKFEGMVYLKGKEGVRFLQNAFEKNRERIERIIGDAVEMIVKEHNE